MTVIAYFDGMMIFVEEGDINQKRLSSGVTWGSILEGGK